ncbi:MAG TPA: transcription termination/antitermination NusG family protein [Caulobacteraceae bacterium]|nr:transcription termination/antitermination NusG family protein [Caulobacteraceae bacterium]
MSTEPPAPAEHDDGPRWRLVRALTGREVLACEQLQNQGFRTFLPKQLKTVRHARKVRVALGAYFPGYLFVEVDLARDRWRSINGTLGVAHLIGAAERPTPVPRGVVEALMAAADERGVIAGPPLKAGQKVRIIAGAFADKLAVIERLDDAGRVRVLLEIVSGQVAVTVARDFLDAAR